MRILRAWKTQRVADVDGKGLGGPSGYRAGRAFATEEVQLVGRQPTRRRRHPLASGDGLALCGCPTPTIGKRSSCDLSTAHSGRSASG